METLVTKFIPFPPDEDEYELLSVSAETFEQISYDSWQYSQQENYLNFNEVDSKHSIWAHNWTSSTAGFFTRPSMLTPWAKRPFVH
ncbi:unnamed protein product [Rhizophagus irregularis]|uniref:Uncharacterized protein n=2 Tax=Rhizophagus irregularis TaxID=588596 RepID=A0A916A1Z3_9GLOM|nr:hypothetical protein RirG_162030 [Rhizophagus irregularis DAOM 197198w]GBC27870.1 hypothetical protein RIR_jg2150.t1 [Rhizophagus irregularis DAOM 181602=DAOM 197198]CAB5395821.1 unnamed protein product [Rhizophagus irregularis]